MPRAAAIAALVLTCALLPAAGAAAADDSVAPSAWTGVLPCADCPGLRTRLTLIDPGRFVLEETWLERRSAVTHGRWVEQDGVVRLLPDDGGERLFRRVGRDRLEPLVTGGRPIEAPVEMGLQRTAPPALNYGTLVERGGRLRFASCTGAVVEVDDATAEGRLGESVRPFGDGAFADLLGYRDGGRLVVIEVERLASDAGGCGHLPADDVILQARGEGWALTIDTAQVLLRLPGGEAAAMPTGRFHWRDGAWRYAELAQAAVVELEIGPGRCTMAEGPEVRGYRVTAVVDGEVREGCGSLGPAWSRLQGAPD